MKYTIIAKYSLYIIALGHVVIGISIPLLVATGGFDAYVHSLNSAIAVPSQDAVNVQKALIALFGPTIASWGILFFLVLKLGIENSSRALFALLLASILCWAIYDSMLSLYFEFYPNLYINFLASILIFIPLLVLKRRIH